MGIAPWRVVQPDFPPEMLGPMLSSYYGGRSEVRIRREIRQVMLCDFLSMYPTVCTLMRLWPFIIANGREDSWIVPSHLTTLGFYILRVRSNLVDSKAVLQQ